MKNVKNQLHPPRPRNKRVDEKGNSYSRIFLKSGTTTMLLCSKATEGDARKIENDWNNIVSFMKERDIKCNITLLKTR